MTPVPTADGSMKREQEHTKMSNEKPADKTKKLCATDEIMEVLDRLTDDVDRSIAIVVMAFVEDQLSRLLKRVLPSTAAAEKWIGSKTATMQGKLEALKGLGLSNEPVLALVRVLSNIRNQFAHNYDLHTFDDNRLDESFKLLEELTRSMWPISIVSPPMPLDRDNWFRLGAMNVVHRFELAGRRIQPAIITPPSPASPETM